LLFLVLGFSSNNVSADRDNHVIVLAYHHLLLEKDMNSNPAIISVENFDNQMRYLKKNGYNTITLDMLNNFLKYNAVLPPKSVLITFDDGYQSNYVYAYPILKNYNYNAAVFVVTKNIPMETQQFSVDRLSHMSLEEIYASTDVFEFACHTHDMHKLDDNKRGQLVTSSREDILKDLQLSKSIINTKYFAYPFGQYNSISEEALRDAGFELAFTVKRGVVSRQSDRLHLNRIPIFNSTTLEDFARILNSVSN
jgi:peptidoglycan/xylan/chitin deacetylase (PgdA/CDA1 family)